MNAAPRFALISTDHWKTFSTARNRALKRRQTLNYQDDNGAVPKVVVKSGDEDTQLVSNVEEGRDLLPPAFTDDLTNIQFEMSEIDRKITQLQSFHLQHLKSAFDDTQTKEHEIEILTKQITHSFQKCQSAIKLIGQRARNSSTQQQRMASNMMSSLAQSLQDKSTCFKDLQNTYLSRLKGREERERMLGVDEDYDKLFNDDVDDMGFVDTRFSNDQIQMVEQNTKQIQQREDEIRMIVENIAELQGIFKDLANLIADQGTVLDRIDYNMEQTVVKVEDAHKELLQAEKHQKRGRKCIFILFLALVVLSLIVALFAIKLKK